MKTVFGALRRKRGSSTRLPDPEPSRLAIDRAVLARRTKDMKVTLPTLKFLNKTAPS